MSVSRLTGLSRHSRHPAATNTFEFDIPNLERVDFERVSEFSFSDNVANSAQSGYVDVPAAENSFGDVSNRAVILGVANTALTDVVDQYRSTKTIFKGHSFRRAGAFYDANGILKAGIFSKDTNFGKIIHEDESLCAVALRQGSGKTFMTMGLVTPYKIPKPHRQMLIPANVQIIDQNVPIFELASRYPDVPLI